jgi:hypothetical protein
MMGGGAFDPLKGRFPGLESTKQPQNGLAFLLKILWAFRVGFPSPRKSRLNRIPLGMTNFLQRSALLCRSRF